MLTKLKEKVKYWFEENRHDIFIAGLIFLVSMASFGLGRLSALWPSKEPLKIIQPANAPLKESAMVAGEAIVSASNPQGGVVASKNGEFFHYPWCSGAKRIKEENKVWFGTKEEAMARGYKPASNCPGL